MFVESQALYLNLIIENITPKTVSWPLMLGVKAWLSVGVSVNPKGVM